MKERIYGDNPNERPLAEILKEVFSRITEIIRSEIRLVTLEARQEVESLKTAAIFIAVGAILAVYGGAFLLLGLVYALFSVWSPWLSAIAVGGVVTIIGGLVVGVAVAKFKGRKVASS
jgi:uncharacterized membrane protein YqjE